MKKTLRSVWGSKNKKGRNKMKNYIILLSLFSFLISDYELDVFRDTYDFRPSMKIYYGDIGGNIGKVKKITGNDEDGYTATIVIYKNDTGFGAQTADIPEITSDMMFRVDNNKIFVDLEGMALKAEEEAAAKAAEEAAAKAAEEAAAKVVEEADPEEELESLLSQ